MILGNPQGFPFHPFEIMPATFETLTHTCDRCDGRGVLPHYGHVASGVCFACKGSGTLSQRVRTDGTVMTSLEVFKRSGQFSYACHRKTILTDSKEWCKCLLSVDLNDVEEVRQMWSTLKGQDHTHLSVTEIGSDGYENTHIYQSW